MRAGFSLVELVVVLAVAGVLLTLGLPSFTSWRDRRAVDRATHEVMAFYQSARFLAVARSRFVRVTFAGDSLRAVFQGVADSVAFDRPGPARHGVTLVASRTSIVIAPTGIGWGGANTKIVLRRGGTGDSLTTSRLGRLKRWD